MPSTVRRLSRPAPPEDCRPDYADAYEVRTDAPDHRSAEQWARTALERAPRLVRTTVLVAHRGLLRFRLGPLTSQDHVLGWRIRRSEDDVIELTADGPLMSGLLVGRRAAPTVTRLETFLFSHRRPAAAVWTVVGPLHRRIAPLLLQRAATPPGRAEAITAEPESSVSPRGSRRRRSRTRCRPDPGRPL